MLTIQFIPHSDIERLDSSKRISKLLKLVKDERIILLEGKLKSYEETELISKTMQQIDNKFKGIELSVINPETKESKDILQKLRSIFLNILMGDRGGFTIIGPASIIKEIKNDPEKIQLLTKDASNKR
ncbi:DUF2073 domain-containing protein [archaeon]|nr:DUF2073 domain-containing protein [archaeon]